MNRREVNKLAQKRWYQNNKQMMIDRQREKRWMLRDWLRNEVIPQYSCKICGESHPACMDFHHRDPSTKVEEISEMAGKKYTKEKILEEISKCDPLCANCHRKHHWTERNSDDSSNGRKPV